MNILFIYVYNSNAINHGQRDNNGRKYDMRQKYLKKLHII